MRLACLVSLSLLLLSGCSVTVVTATCSDAILNGNESDTDCGGSCAACSNGRRCFVNADCQSGVCDGTGVCSGGVVTGLPSSAGAQVYHIDTGAALAVTPGQQAGYGILANVGGSFRVVWTGEGASTGSFNNFTGTVWTTAVIDSVTPGCQGQCDLESGDVVSAPTAVTGGYRVDFDTVASTGLDGFDFTVTAESSQQPVYFDLLVDGVRNEQLVFYTSGGVLSGTATDPFGLTTQ
jgi:hypothetical protein